MKTGYVISVLDKQVGDRAFKVILGDRSNLDAKKAKIEENYKKLEGEFEVITESQYSEASEEDFSKIRIHPSEGFKIGDFHNHCDAFDYILSDWDQESWAVDVYKGDLSKMLELLGKQNINYSKV